MPRRYLADSSIWGWANSGRRPGITQRLADRYRRAEVVICVPIALEVLHRPRDGAAYERLYGELFQPLDWLPLDEGIARRALEVQRQMSHGPHGNHLRPAVDFLIAAIAEAAGDDVILWAFDRDLELICDHTGQPHEGERSGGDGPS